MIKLSEKDYWEKKIKTAAIISSNYGFPEYDEEFWKYQSAGVISLLINLHDEIVSEDLKFKNRFKLRIHY